MKSVISIRDFLVAVGNNINFVPLADLSVYYGEVRIPHALETLSSMSIPLPFHEFCFSSESASCF